MALMAAVSPAKILIFILWSFASGQSVPTRSPLSNGQTHSPTLEPTLIPTLEPTLSPTSTPTTYPSLSPTRSPLQPGETHPPTKSTWLAACSVPGAPETCTSEMQYTFDVYEARPCSGAPMRTHQVTTALSADACASDLYSGVSYQTSCSDAWDYGVLRLAVFFSANCTPETANYATFVDMTQPAWTATCLSRPDGTYATVSLECDTIITSANPTNGTLSLETGFLPRASATEIYALVIGLILANFVILSAISWLRRKSMDTQIESIEMNQSDFDPASLDNIETIASDDTQLTTKVTNGPRNTLKLAFILGLLVLDVVDCSSSLVLAAEFLRTQCGDDTSSGVVPEGRVLAALVFIGVIMTSFEIFLNLEIVFRGNSLIFITSGHSQIDAETGKIRGCRNNEFFLGIFGVLTSIVNDIVPATLSLVAALKLGNFQYDLSAFYISLYTNYFMIGAMAIKGAYDANKALGSKCKDLGNGYYGCIPVWLNGLLCCPLNWCLIVIYIFVFITFTGLQDLDLVDAC